MAPTEALNTNNHNTATNDGDDETAATTNVDLSLLDTWIDDDDQDDKKDDPFRIVRKTQLEKLTSRDAFDARLHTFRPLTYFCKPTSLSPIVCARFGWINTSLDMLKCVSCKVALMITIHSKIQKRATLQRLIRAYQTKLATAHKETCPFRFEAELYLLPPQKEEAGDDNDDNSQPEEPPKRMPKENVVPPHFASILPRDVWEMIEQPVPLSLVQRRFQQLLEYIVQKDDTDSEEGAPPQWQFPPLILPDYVLAFQGANDSHISNNNSGNKDKDTRKNRLLARLAFDSKQPSTAIGWEKETLLTRLEEILRPPREEDEIRAQTRAQGAWEDLHEGFAALALFGWVPTAEATDSKAPASSIRNTKEEDGSVSLECPVCLARSKFSMQKYDPHHRHSPRKTKPLDNSDGDDAPPSKRRRLHEQSHQGETLNPLTSHRYHCPYVCGFPKDGERKGTPIWQTIASKLLLHKPVANETSDSAEKDDDGDAATDRLLQLLQSGVSSHKNRKDAENELIF